VTASKVGANCGLSWHCPALRCTDNGAGAPVANQVHLRRKTASAAPEGLLGSVAPGISVFSPRRRLSRRAPWSNQQTRVPGPACRRRAVAVEATPGRGQSCHLGSIAGTGHRRSARGRSAQVDRARRRRSRAPRRCRLGSCDRRAENAPGARASRAKECL